MILNVAGEAADKVVEIALDTITVIAKLSGKGIKEAIYILDDISRNKLKNATGRQSLEKMMKICDNVEIFTLKQKDLEKFMEEAEKYGILYCTILDRKNENPEASVDLFVKGEDAIKVNRIVQRYKIEVVDVANLRAEQIKEKGELDAPVDVPEQEGQLPEEKKNNVDENLINLIIGEDPVKELSEAEYEERLKEGVSNNFLLEDNPSENSSEIKNLNISNSDKADNTGKKSVRAELKKCKEEIKNMMKQKDTREKPAVSKKNKKKLKGEKKHGKVK